MKRCPVCGNHGVKTIDSREKKGGTIVRRRRECLACHHRFTTYEGETENVIGVDPKVVAKLREFHETIGCVLDVLDALPETKKRGAA